MKSALDMLDRAFNVIIKNLKNFSLFHLHLTFNGEISKEIPSTKIILPISNNFGVVQNLTTIKIYNENQVMGFRLMLREEIERNKVFGIKVEGVNFKGNWKELEDFCYFENHCKVDRIEDLPVNDFSHFSISLKREKILGLKRLYSLDEHKNSYSGGEICIFEHWFKNIEEDWLRVPQFYQVEYLKSFNRF